MSTHARFAPSSMDRTVKCTRWVSLAATVPPLPPSQASKEGDTAHQVALMGALSPALLEDLEGMLSPSTGIEIQDWMIDGANLWIEALEGFPARLEEYLPIQRIHMKDCGGTPDARQWSPETRTLRLADYKSGFGYVDAFENYQLLPYAIGEIDRLLLHTRHDINIEMMVVQPRYYKANAIRSWTITIDEIWPYLEVMQKAVRAAELGTGDAVAGPWCTHCPARLACSVFKQSTAALIDFAGQSEPLAIVGDEVGAELRLVQAAIDRLKSRATGLEAVAESMLKAGQRVPYFALEPSVGRLKWDEGQVDTAEFTANLAGKSVMSPAKPLTPMQVKTQKILPKELVDTLASRPRGALKLVPDISNTKARRIFK